MKQHYSVLWERQTDSAEWGFYYYDSLIRERFEVNDFARHQYGSTVLGIYNET